MAPNGEKRPPPPVKPKPATLVSRPSQDNVFDHPQPTTASRPPVIRANSISTSSVTSNSNSNSSSNDSGIESTSTSFGDLRKAFERNPIMSTPPFQTQSTNQTTPSWRASTYATATRFQSSTPTTGATVAASKPLAASGSLRVPSGNTASRPRSISTPAPPVPPPKPAAASTGQSQGPDLQDQNGGGAALFSSSTSTPSASVKGLGRDDIDDRQPDFSNLRARFQHQASSSTTSVNSITAPPKPKPKPALTPKPTSSPTSPPSTWGDFGSTGTGTGTGAGAGGIQRLPKPSSAPIGTIPPTRTTPLSQAPTSDNGPMRFPTPNPPNTATRQAPRPPPPPITRGARSSSISKPPIPPTSSATILPARTPTPTKPFEHVAATATAEPEGDDDNDDEEKNPFMGSDEDEMAAAAEDTRAADVAPPLPLPPPTPPRFSTISSPTLPQLNRSSSNSSSISPSRPMGSTAFHKAVNTAKVASPPQRPPPRPISPSGPPPMLPKRSASSGSTVASLTSDTPEEAERKHRLDKRRRVVQELLETELSYAKDMMLLQEEDEKLVFGNLDEIISLTIDFGGHLTEACGGLIEEGHEDEYQDAKTFVGRAFQMEMSNIRRVFSEYCKRNDAAAAHLQALQSRKELQLFFDLCKEKCRGKSTAWDLASMLIKPVQRVLKYPLLINQIYALTPREHMDYEALAEVQGEIHVVAEEINEIKKRKDIVEKIVGSKKKTDSDVVHGFNKKFARTAQQLRQAVIGSEVTVDILFEALLEKFNLQQKLIRDFAKYIQAWLVSMKLYFDNQEAMATTLSELYGLAPIYANDEMDASVRIKKYHQELAQFSRTIGRELESQLKRTVYRSIDNFLKLYSGPLQVMKKREKKLLDYDRVREAKDRGDNIDKHMEESAAAYTAINAQLIEELPKFLGLMTQYFDRIVMEFGKIQGFFYEKVHAKLLSFYIANIDSSLSRLSPGDLSMYLEEQKSRIFDDYERALRRPQGGLERLLQVRLLHNVASTHEMAFQDIRENATQRRKRSSSVSAPSLPSRSGSASSLSLSRAASTGSSLNLLVHPMQQQAKKAAGAATVGSSSASTSSSQSGRETPSSLVPMPRYFPSAYENPFEMESVFNDDANGSVADSDDFGFAASRPPSTYTMGGGGGGARSSTSSTDLFGGRGLNESTSSLGSFSTTTMATGKGSSSGGGGSSTRPPALDDGMDDDEIGLAQALFECTAIYPHQGEDARELTFVPGESIVVFGLNDNGWWFGKKIGKEAKGWFPASHCIQI
ncbi:hypothetical protein DFQ26_004428 [Actinomortierella ambigua]|nr:hypothetical protein DFQ26_004428 [Actinomortierella ambigua]